MRILHALVVQCWIVALKLASFFNAKAKDAISLRRGWRQELAEILVKEEEWAWIHCASIGEYNDISETAFRLTEKIPGIKLLYTFQSPTGYHQFKDNKDLDGVILLPFDTLNNAREFIEMVKPRLILFSRSELWYSYLSLAAQKKIPAYLVGFRITNSNHYFSFLIRRYYQRCFQLFQHILCDDEHTAQLLKQNNFHEEVTVVGNPRIDRIVRIKEKRVGEKGKPHFPIRRNKRIQDSLEKVELKGATIVAGSMSKSDLPFVVGAISSSPKVIHWIIVPHEVDEKSLVTWERAIPRPSQRFTRWVEGDPFPEILILDTVGDLPFFYQLADLAIVGGGFSRKGIHNILEPISFGVPVASGPNHRRYIDAVNLMEIGGLTVYQSSEELCHWIANNISDSTSPSDTSSELSEQLLDYLEAHAGASEKIVRIIARSVL